MSAHHPIDGRPLHKPIAEDVPIPGGPYWYAGCDPDGAYVNADGTCEGCGRPGCPVCGYEECGRRHDEPRP